MVAPSPIVNPERADIEGLGALGTGRDYTLACQQRSMAAEQQGTGSGDNPCAPIASRFTLLRRLELRLMPPEI